MKSTTSLSPDHQLDRVAGQFAHWRQHRSHPSERIPQPLWDQAVALTAMYPYSHVAKHLRLSPSDLKKQMLAQQASPSQSPISALRFVEVPTAPEPRMLAPSIELELQRADGARLCVRSCDARLSLPALVHVFLEAHSCSN